MEGQLVDYFEENIIEARGVHLQAGLRFKLLLLTLMQNFATQWQRMFKMVLMDLCSLL